ncbi:50S ribosomal protein L1 [Candidatus Bathyarchaeota archaeon]|nr:50S ribosomal protein L1 [Candidatus Bathyarchaeota archaeon]MBS7636682.1 50S ribosomal protein L1 [Candidatus Bathyarchaeota archaeon]
MPIEQKTLLSALKEVKEKSGKRNFTQSVELILNLQDIDMKSPEGRLQENVELPYPPAEKPNKICVIATGELALKAKRANADLVLDRTELEGLAGKKKDLRKLANEYDFFIAEAPLMPLVGRVLGPVLGPRGKMPVPVPPTADIESLLKKYHKTVVVRMRNQPVIQCRIGTENMKEEELAENIQAVFRVVEGKLKRGMKNIKSVCIKTTMGTPVKIKL